MKMCVLINSAAGPSTSNDPLRDALRNNREFEIRELSPDDDWAAVIASVLKGRYDVIVAAGGDGTIHAVVNALLESGSRTTLGIVPLGTGNDLCRTLAIPFDPVESLRLLAVGRVRALDAIRIAGARTGHLVNAATGGFSGQVAAETTSEIKESWGPLGYLRGAIGALTNLPRFPLKVRFDDGPVERFDVLNIVIANARTAAGGVLVAPAANPEDGLLDVVIVRHGESLDLALLASRLMHGNYVDDENVVHRRAKRVELEADCVMPFSMDGERCEGRRFTFEIVPHSLRIVVGPGYAPAPDAEPSIEAESPRDEAAGARSPQQWIFGLITGLLLVVKRIRHGPGLAAAGVLTALLLCAWLAQGVVAGAWREWNERLLGLARANASESLDRFALVVTWFGGRWGAALVVAFFLLLLLRSRQYLTAGTFLAAVSGVLLMEVVLKPFFALSRPEMNAEVLAVTGHSFPSGHALRGVGIYGTLAAFAAGRARERSAWWLAVALAACVAVGICWSRVHLGVHWPTDVIMGALLAATWVAICLIARHQVQARSRTGGSMDKDSRASSARIP